MKTPLIVGSVAFDIIFSIHGDIKDEILLQDGKVDKVNMMFTARGKKQYFGGTAGNISYGLGMLGAKSKLFSVVGKDFVQSYEKHLKNSNVDLRVRKINDKFTATYYGISDEKYQQIGIWQPDAYGEFIEQSSLTDTIDEKEFEDISVAIFSPGTGVSTRNHMLELRQKLKDSVNIIFDPSQVLSIFYTPELLKECLSLCNIVIGNDNEIAQFKTIFGYSVKDLLDMGIDAVVETLGEKGVNIHTKKGNDFIEPVKPEKVVETTGAGDAFRSGFIYGLINGKSLADSAKIGAILGAKSVEEYGGQLYTIDKNIIT